MKNLAIAILITFASVQGFTQVPDTIFYQPFTQVATETTSGTSDSGMFLIYETKTLPNSLLKVAYPIDKPMTGEQVAEYVFNLIYRNENLNWLDEARVQQRIKANNLMPTANKILQDFTGAGYFPYARNKFIAQFQGVYRVAAVNKSVEYFLIRANGTIVQCDETGTIISGGKTGALQILTENRFRVVSYFGDTVAIFNKELDSPFFFSTIAQARIRKIKSI
jgi:hypothetical protein